jgi:phage protein D
MNRIQFWVLTGLSSLIVLFLVLQLIVVHYASNDQANLAAAQQRIQRGQASQQLLKQMALRIYTDSQKTQDPGLKDLMSRQQIQFNPSTDASSTDSATPTPAPTPAPLH